MYVYMYIMRFGCGAKEFTRVTNKEADEKKARVRVWTRLYFLCMEIKLLTRTAYKGGLETFSRTSGMYLFVLCLRERRDSILPINLHRGAMPGIWWVLPRNAYNTEHCVQ